MSVKSRGGGSASGSAARGGKAPAVSSKDVQTIMSSGLDLTGTDDMEIDKMYVLKSGVGVLRKPDGRTCLTCFLRDDMWCAFYIAVEKVKRYVQWGQVDARSGESFSTRCYCCLKHSNSQIRYSRVPSVTLVEYETELGTDMAKLELHQSRIIAMIYQAIERGCFNFTVNWTITEKKAVSLQHKISMIKTKPGFQWMPTSFYQKKYGDLATNGKRSEGHRPWSLEGEQGVLVPDDPVVFIEFQEQVSSLWNQELGNSDSMWDADLQRMHSSVGNSFWG